MTAGALPGGLTLNGSTGVISGTPSATGDNATIKVSNTSGDDSGHSSSNRVVRKPKALISGKKYGDIIDAIASSDVSGRTLLW